MKKLIALFLNIFLCVLLIQPNTVYADSVTDYYLLDYIQSTGNNYIDTGYYTNPNTKVIAKFAWQSTAVQQRLFGVNDGTSSNVNVVYYLTGSAPGVNGYRYGSRGYNPVGGTYGQRPHVADGNIHTINLNNSSISYDSSTYYHSNSLSGTSGLSLLIFAQSNWTNGQPDAQRCAVVRLYTMQIYDGNTMRRNYVAAKRKSDNVVGLYDLQNNVFYTKGGTRVYMTDYNQTQYYTVQDFKAGSLQSAGTLNLETQTGGSVSGAGTIYKDADGNGRFTAVASASADYYFDGWYSDSARTNLVSSNASYSDTMTSDRTLYAKFVAKSANTVSYPAQSWNYAFSTQAQTKVLSNANNAQGTVTYSLSSQPSGNYFSLNGTTLSAAANTPVGEYGLVVSANATGDATHLSGVANSAVTVTVGPAYTISIPTDIDIEQGGTFSYSVADGRNISITATSLNGNKLMNGSSELKYTSGNSSWQSLTGEGSKQLNYTIDDTPNVAGEYKDTLTFSVSVGG